MHLDVFGVVSIGWVHQGNKRKRKKEKNSITSLVWQDIRELIL